MSGRPPKYNLDYFPHEVKHGATLSILQNHFGNDGYAFWFKLIELVADSDNLIYEVKTTIEWEEFLAYMKVNEDLAKYIMNLLSNIGKIDKELWKYKIVWIPTLIKRVEHLFKKRKLNIPQKPQLPEQKLQLNSISESDIQNSDTEILQSKVKESKVNKYSQNSNEFRLANLLLSLIIERRNSLKKPDLQKWCIHIDRMIRIDKRIPTEIEKVIRWCQQDDFWQNNILSTQKLREQFDQLALKIPQIKSEKTPEEKLLTDEDIRENKRLSELYDRMGLKTF